MTPLLLCLLARVVFADDAWLQPGGPGALVWGTGDQPLDVVRRPKDFFLPDAGYIGSGPTDRPEDVEIPGPHPRGERRFLRYVHGALVDAWLVRDGSIDTAYYTRAASEQWQGVVLGPSTEGYRALGDAVSWQTGERTVMHWVDRMSGREILVSRAVPSRTYAVRREAALARPPDTGTRARITGELKAIFRPMSGELSSCLDLAPKPVIANLDVIYDSTGRPGRVRFGADQPAPGALECVGGAVASTTAGPGTTGSVEIFRMR